MKNIFNKSYILLFALITVAFSACVEPIDLVTQNAQTGGLVDPQVSNFPYKLGATTSFDVGVEVPIGPAIQSVEVSNVFVSKAGDESNEVVMSIVDIAGANTSNVVATSFTLTYADLKSGIMVNGNPLPDNDVDLTIGDSWTLKYTAIMSDDSRKVINNATTNIGVANQYAGNYQVTGVFDHPTAGPRAINREKFLNPIDAYTCMTYVGDLSGYEPDYNILIIVNPDNSVTVKADEGATEVIMTAGEPNEYDPATGIFTLNYYYVGGTGNRVISEVYTPL
jgi:hypothetical protein